MCQPILVGVAGIRIRSLCKMEAPVVTQVEMAEQCRVPGWEQVVAVLAGQSVAMPRLPVWARFTRIRIPITGSALLKDLLGILTETYSSSRYLVDRGEAAVRAASVAVVAGRF